VVGALLLALVVAPIACGSRRSLRTQADDSVIVRVSNNHSLDVTVYAVNQSMRVRLGTVSTASTAHFRLALHDVSPSGELRLLADPVGARRTTLSEAIQVFPGQVIEWVLAADLRMSSLTIRS
jgi:hypothetical protein